MLWGLVIGALVKAGLGTVLTSFLSVGFLLPSLHRWRGFGPLVGFGLRFQANWLLITLREQGINAVTAVIGGVSILGLWTLATRLLQVPFTRVQFTVYRGVSGDVTSPRSGEKPAPVIMRVVRRGHPEARLLFSPAFAASSPELVPALFGGEVA